MYLKTLSFVCFFIPISLADNYQSITVSVNENIAGKALHHYVNTWWQWTIQWMTKALPYVIKRVSNAM
jgi:hypothetical protein